MRRHWKFAGMLAALAFVPLLMAPTGGIPQRLKVRSVRIGQVNPLVALTPTTPCDLCFQNVVDSTGVAGTATQGFFTKNVSTAALAVNYGLEVANDTTAHEIVVGNTSTTRATTVWPSGPTGEQKFIESIDGTPICIAGAVQAWTCWTNTAYTFGNPTDNPTYTFAGTGTTTLGGNLAVTGTSATVGGSQVALVTHALIKASTTSRTNTAALAADPDLTFTPTASADYKIDFCLYYNGNATGTQGIKVAFNRTSAGSNFFMWQGGHNVVGTGSSFALSTAGNPGGTNSQFTQATISVASSRDYTCGTGILNASSGVGYAVEWAQASANANATNMIAGSYMRATRLN